jgi:hypothetical protein
MTTALSAAGGITRLPVAGHTSHGKSHETKNLSQQLKLMEKHYGNYTC